MNSPAGRSPGTCGGAAPTDLTPASLTLGGPRSWAHAVRLSRSHHPISRTLARHLRMHTRDGYHGGVEGAIWMTQRWTAAQQRDSVAEYRRTRIPYCPLDHTSLHVDRDTSLTDPHA